MSLPTRECGLKLTLCVLPKSYALSLPTRECGLKLGLNQQQLAVDTVTPHAGVWIETGKLP